MLKNVEIKNQSEERVEIKSSVNAFYDPRFQSGAFGLTFNAALCQNALDKAIKQKRLPITIKTKFSFGHSCTPSISVPLPGLYGLCS